MKHHIYHNELVDYWIDGQNLACNIHQHDELEAHFLQHAEYWIRLFEIHSNYVLRVSLISRLLCRQLSLARNENKSFYSEQSNMQRVNIPYPNQNITRTCRGDSVWWNFHEAGIALLRADTSGKCTGCIVLYHTLRDKLVSGMSQHRFR